jgi:hypothetical protein
MAEMLLINPQRRKTRRKTAAKRRTTVRVRKNPMTITTNVRRRVKRRNPMQMMRRSVMRRRNPIGTGMASSYLRDVREALMAGAGAVVFDIVHGQIKRFLPTSLQVTPGSIGAGDAVRAVITVVVGQALNKVTRGFSKKAAMASLTVQAHDLLKGFVPAALPLGYMSPAMVAQGTNRIGPIRGTTGMNAYMRPGPTPLLSAYTSGTPLLNGSASRREGVSTYY